MQKAKVYFTKELTPESVVKMYEVLSKNLSGRVAVKVHSGEQGNQNYLKPLFMSQIVKRVNGTIVECNTAYEGARNTSSKHKDLLKTHGWSELFDVDLLDETGPDKVLDIPNSKIM